MEFAQLPRQSEDLKQTNVAKLAELFPHCVTEGKNGLEVNFEVLHALLGGENLTNRGG